MIDTHFEVVLVPWVYIRKHFNTTAISKCLYRCQHRSFTNETLPLHDGILHHHEPLKTQPLYTHLQSSSGCKSSLVPMHAAWERLSPPTQLAVNLELVGNSASGTAHAVFSSTYIYNKNPVHHLEILHTGTTSFPELGQDLGTSLSHRCHGLIVSEAASHTAVNHHQTLKHSQKGPLCELYRDFRIFAKCVKRICIPYMEVKILLLRLWLCNVTHTFVICLHRK